MENECYLIEICAFPLAGCHTSDGLEGTEEGGLGGET